MVIFRLSSWSFKLGSSEVVVSSAARRPAAMVFDLNAPFGKKQQRATPKASDLFKSKSDGHSLPEPEQSVLDMGWRCQQWLCVVVTTDVPVIRKLAASPGQFGHLRHFNKEDAKPKKVHYDLGDGYAKMATMSNIQQAASQNKRFNIIVTGGDQDKKPTQ